MIRFNVSVILRSVALLRKAMGKSDFDIISEVKRTMRYDKAPLDEIRTKMKDKGIPDELLGLFDKADSDALADEYVTVYDAPMSFDYNRAAKLERSEACIQIACDFDDEKFITKIREADVPDSREGYKFEIGAHVVTTASPFIQGKIIDIKKDEEGRNRYIVWDDERRDWFSYFENELKRPETIMVQVFRDTVVPELAGDDNITEIEVDRNILLDWFRVNILESFRGDDTSISDEGLLDEWLDEYTADETTGLYGYMLAVKNKDNTIKKEEDDNEVIPAHVINGFILTDDDSLQYGKKLGENETGDEVWAFIQEESMGEDVRIRANILKISDFESEYVKDAVKGYYPGGLTEVMETYKDNWQQIVLEILFESSSDCLFAETTSGEKESYELIRKYLTSFEKRFLKDCLDAEEKLPLKSVDYYIREYNLTLDNLVEKYKEKGYDDPSYRANQEFEEVAESVDVIGYYLQNYDGDEKEALHTWIENLLYARQRGAEIRPQDKEITAILSYLAGETVVIDINWHVEAGTDTTKLSEVKYLPFIPDRNEIKQLTLDYILNIIESGYGCRVNSFITFLCGEPVGYEPVRVEDIEWYVVKGKDKEYPKETSVRRPSFVPFDYDAYSTQCILEDLVKTYGAVPVYFKYFLPDGRPASYRNWDLSSYQKSEDEKKSMAEHLMADITGVGCHGSASEACLNVCTGCDKK